MIEYNGKKLTIMACSQCNINCKHCYISYKGNRTPEELKELVTKFKDKHKVEINGAEVLTNLRYIESYPIVHQDFIMTNGVAIAHNPSILDYLKENGIRQIFMSFHLGIHEDISPVDVEMLENNINNILSRGLKLKLYVTVTQKNYKYIHEIVQKAIAYGAISVRFTNYIRQGNAQNLSDENILSPEQANEFIQLVEQERSLYDQSFMDIERCGSFGNCGTKKFKCYAVNNNVVLTPDNNVYPCIFLAKPGYEIGYYDGNKIQLFDECRNDGSECIARNYCNYHDEMILQRKLGVKNK